MKPFLYIFSYLVGISLQISSYSTIACLISSVVFILAGIIITLISKGQKAEFNAFFLSYSFCTLFAGSLHIYAENMFGDNMTALDAKLFRALVADYFSLSISQLAEVINSPLAVYVWAKLRSIFGFFGVQHGAWIDIQFNALIVSLAGVFTVKSARILNHKNKTILEKAGFLYALSGPAILFGSLLFRDCYGLFLNSIWLFFTIKALARPNLKNLIIVLFITLVSMATMLLIREKAVYIFAFFLALAIGSWYLSSGFSPTKIFFAMVILGAALVSFDYLSSQTSQAVEASTEKSKNYSKHSNQSNQQESLGLSYIVNQPLPIRLAAGSVYLIVRPIPLWSYFHSAADEYLLLKGYNGIFMVLIFPLVVLGLRHSIKRITNRRDKKGVLLFLSLYAIFSYLLVAATTLEIRHVGQFATAVILLATIANPRTKQNIQFYSKAKSFWITFVVAIHAAWAILKFVV